MSQANSWAAFNWRHSLVMFDVMTLAAKSVYEFIGYPPDEVTQKMRNLTDVTVAQFSHLDDTAPQDTWLFAMLGPKQLAATIDAAEHLPDERKAKLKSDLVIHPMMTKDARRDGPCMAIFELTLDSCMLNDGERKELLAGRKMIRVVGARFAPLALCTATIQPALLFTFQSWDDVKTMMKKYFDMFGTEMREDNMYAVTIFPSGIDEVVGDISRYCDMSIKNFIEGIEYPREELLRIMPRVRRVTSGDPLRTTSNFMLFSLPE